MASIGESKGTDSVGSTSETSKTKDTDKNINHGIEATRRRGA